MRCVQCRLWLIICFGLEEKESVALCACASQNIMEGHRKPLKPRLERRNAMKNIDYRLKEDEDTDTDTDIDIGSLDERSFRVEGIDGEFDRIFRSLGLSGPEDFAIPAAAWKEAQAQKARSTVNLQHEPPPQNKKQREGGINGVRPPILEPTQVTSSWTTQQPTDSDSVSRDEDSVVGVEAEIEKVSALVGNETFDVQNLSLNATGYFGSWQKGEILGKGSFGTVYEGFTESVHYTTLLFILFFSSFLELPMHRDYQNKDCKFVHQLFDMFSVSHSHTCFEKRRTSTNYN